MARNSVLALKGSRKCSQMERAVPYNLWSMEQQYQTKGGGAIFFKRVLQGGTFGLGVIPGVSSATLAYIAGIYDTFVNALANVRKEFKRSMRIILLVLLGALLSGGISLLLFSWGYHKAPLAVTSLFAGVISGSLPLVYDEIKNQKKSASFFVLIGISFLVASGIGAASFATHYVTGFDFSKGFSSGAWWAYLAIFFCGFISSATTIIPGISGAMVLFVMGLYDPMISLYFGEHSVFARPEIWTQVLGLSLSMVAGLLVGILAAGKGINYVLLHHREKTFDVAFGFVSGSIVSMFLSENIFIEKTMNGVMTKTTIYLAAPIWEWVVSILLFLTALVLFFWISKKGILQRNKGRQEEKESQEEVK